VPVSGVRPRSASTRHECFVTDASVSVKTAETAELDELESSQRRRATRSLTPREAVVIGKAARRRDIRTR
jgi:hypothetical protein